VAYYGSFSKAADALGYTQSAVSQQISALERLIGQRLVKRSAGSPFTDLTELGARIAPHIDAILDRLLAARADVDDYAGAATLRLGTFPSVGVRILPKIMQELVDRPGSPRITLTESNSEDDLLDLVERRDLDITFACVPRPERPITFQELLIDPFVLVVARKSPLANRATPLSLEEIAGERLVGLDLCVEAIAVENYFAKHRFELDFVFRSSDNGTLLGLVAAGVGAALVPGLLVDPADTETVAIELDERIPARRIALAWHQDRPAALPVEMFVRAAWEACRQLASGGQNGPVPT
jgi:DNA-binding transcriptional LysR family regulator